MISTNINALFDQICFTSFFTLCQCHFMLLLEKISVLHSKSVKWFISRQRGNGCVSSHHNCPKIRFGIG